MGEKIIICKSRSGKREFGKDFNNKITDEMDDMLLFGKSKNPYFNTYIQLCGNEHNFAIRYPGATRGHILTDENDIITQIKLYHDIPSIDIYKKETEKYLQKYIGYKIVFEKSNDDM